jgi:DMSO/TMAO reductase YedYZ molybdopterin-dependent catalytic subunit
MIFGRRPLLTGATLAGLDVLLGCGANGAGAAGPAGAGGGGGAGGAGGGGCGGVPVGCADPFAAGERLAVIDLDDAAGVAFHTPSSQGLDGRLYTDLSVLDHGCLVTPTEHFYVRTFYPDALAPPAVWTLELGGLVERPVSVTIDEIRTLAAPQGVHVLECAGNSGKAAFGLLSAAQWSGAPLSVVLAKAKALPAATRVLVGGHDEHTLPSANGHSTPGASWIFAPADLKDAFLATEMNGAPLGRDHGEPVRLFVPGWYGCTCIKWVNEIRWVDESAPATSQMKEFAGRTHQRGTPELARDYVPATLDQAAMPVRIEKWLVAGALGYRIVGILWGGSVPTDALEVRFGEGAAWEKVAVCPAHAANATWTLWSHRWRPRAPGTYAIRCRIADPRIRTRRLDAGYYDRKVTIEEV